MCFSSASRVSVSPGARSRAGVEGGSWILKSGTKTWDWFLTSGKEEGNYVDSTSRRNEINRKAPFADQKLTIGVFDN